MYVSILIVQILLLFVIRTCQFTVYANISLNRNFGVGIGIDIL